MKRRLANILTKGLGLVPLALVMAASQSAFAQCTPGGINPPTISVNPSIIDDGGPLTLSWSLPGGSCTITASPAVSGLVPTQPGTGSITTLKPHQNTTFYASCGAPQSGGGCAKVDLTVRPATPTPCVSGCTPVPSPTPTPAPGSVMPKFVVLSVVYAPPGSRSQVVYSNNETVGTKTSWANAFTKTTTSAISISQKLPIFAGSSVSNSWSQTADAAGSIAISTSATTTSTFPGPQNSDAGIVHDFDVIAVWLNAKADFNWDQASQSLKWKWVVDARDPVIGMDVVYLTVYDLKHPSNLAGNTGLQRAWAGAGEGLTLDDYAQILSVDPFANSDLTISASRFSPLTSVSYTKPACGGQAIGHSYNLNYQTALSNSSSATSSYTVKLTATVNPWVLKVENSQMYQWTNKTGKEYTSSSSTGASFNVVGPSNCNYDGEQTIDVYQDNVYGTFMFAYPSQPGAASRERLPIILPIEPTPTPTGGTPVPTTPPATPTTPPATPTPPPVTPTPPPAGTPIPGARDISDFNHDGKTDLLWQRTDGLLLTWYMNGLTATGMPAFTNQLSLAGWTAVGTGDFNADGQTDVVFQRTDGAVVVWFMNGIDRIGGATIYGDAIPGWTIRGVADFNHDGWPDLLWQNSEGGSVVWFMTGATKSSGATISASPQPGWHIAATGDFNNDGNADLLWQRDDGAMTLWYMNGAAMTSWTWVYQGAIPGWYVRGTGDFNGDGKTDIVWQASDGSVVVWYMNGVNKAGDAWIYSSPIPGWTIRNSK